MKPEIARKGALKTLTDSSLGVARFRRERLNDCETLLARKVFQKRSPAESARQFSEQVDQRNPLFASTEQNAKDGKRRVSGGKSAQGTTIASEIGAKEKAAIRLPAANSLLPRPASFY